MLFAAAVAVLICSLPLIIKIYGIWEASAGSKVIILLLAGWPLLTAIVTGLFLRRSALRTGFATLASMLLLIAAISGVELLANHWDWVLRSGLEDYIVNSIYFVSAIPYAFVVALIVVHLYRVLKE